MTSIVLEEIISKAKANFGKIQNDAFEAKPDLNNEIKALKEHADKVEQAIRALEEMKHNLENLTTN